MSGITYSVRVCVCVCQVHYIQSQRSVWIWERQEEWDPRMLFIFFSLVALNLVLRPLGGYEAGFEGIFHIFYCFLPLFCDKLNFVSLFWHFIYSIKYDESYIYKDSPFDW